MAVRAALLAALACSVAAAAAPDLSAGSLLIHDAWARPTPPGITVGAVYLSIVNRGATDDRLTGVSSPLAAQGEIHETSSHGGVMNMRPVGELRLPHGDTVHIQPGGVHVMLTGLRQPWVPGSQVPLTLVFKSAGSVTLNVPVEARE